MGEETRMSVEWIIGNSLHADIIAAICAVADDFATELSSKDIYKALKYVAEVWEEPDD